MRVKIVMPIDNHSEPNPRVWEFLSHIHELRPGWTIVKSRSALISRARNEGTVGLYTDLKYPNHLLDHEVYAYVDSDVVPDVHAYLRVIEGVGSEDFMTGCYKGRGTDAYALGITIGHSFRPYTLEEAKVLDYADWAGGGLLFIGVGALRTIAYPYFHEGVISWKDESNRERAAIIGEDVVFCDKVRKAGVKLRVANSLFADHIGA